MHCYLPTYQPFLSHATEKSSVRKTTLSISWSFCFHAAVYARPKHSVPSSLCISFNSMEYISCKLRTCTFLSNIHILLSAEYDHRFVSTKIESYINILKCYRRLYLVFFFPQCLCALVEFFQRFCTKRCEELLGFCETLNN